MLFRKIILLSTLSTIITACSGGTSDVADTDPNGDIFENIESESNESGSNFRNAEADTDSTNVDDESGAGLGQISTDPIDNPGSAGASFSNDSDLSGTVCIDTVPFGNGWGWDGTQSCRIEISDTNSLANTDSTNVDDESGAGLGQISTDPINNSGSAGASFSNDSDLSGTVCIDTVPFGNGWGWDGTQSCRIEISDTNSLVELFGFVKLYPDRSQTDFIRGTFGRLPNSLTEEEIREFYLPKADTCEVTAASDSVGETQFRVLDQQLNLISSGETVLINSNAGSFATLNRVYGQHGPRYQTDAGLYLGTPVGLTVDVLGDDFPAFSSAPISDVQSLKITNPVGQNIDAFTNFTWNQNADSFSVVEIYTGGAGANNEEIIVGCTAIDDGAFTFPGSVRARMGSDFDERWTAYLRIVYTIIKDDNALLVTANSTFADSPIDSAPVDPEDPQVDPEDSQIDDPQDPPVEPVDPPVVSVDPPVVPVDPPVEPVDPPVVPVDPPVVPVDPPVVPVDPSPIDPIDFPVESVTCRFEDDIQPLVSGNFNLFQGANFCQVFANSGRTTLTISDRRNGSQSDSPLFTAPVLSVVLRNGPCFSISANGNSGTNADGTACPAARVGIIPSEEANACAALIPGCTATN